jgi:hypothetical protein
VEMEVVEGMVRGIAVQLLARAHSQIGCRRERTGVARDGLDEDLHCLLGV